MIDIAKAYLSKTKIVALIAAMLVILLLAGGALLFMYQKQKPALASASLAEAVIERDSLSLPSLVLAEKTTYGAELNILCDASSAKELGFAEGDSVCIQAAHRNDHFELDTDTKINFTVADNFEASAREDLLSGSMGYNLYACNPMDIVSLMTQNSLRDISGSVIESGAGYNAEISDMLSAFGKKYFIATAVADMRRSVMAIGFKGDSLGLYDLAKSGEFTYENFISTLKSSGASFGYGEGGEFALYYGASGGFAHFDAGKLAFASYTDSILAFDALGSFLKNGAVTKDKEGASFALMRIGDLGTLGSDRGILPLPKESEGAKYHSYFDFDGATVLAMPSEIKDADKFDTLFLRYMELSQIYMAECVTNEIATNSDNAEMLAIIEENLGCDHSVLFGYGDVRAMISETLASPDLFAVNYYNRRALFEKAISIIEKRIV